MSRFFDRAAKAAICDTAAAVVGGAVAGVPGAVAGVAAATVVEAIIKVNSQESAESPAKSTSHNAQTCGHHQAIIDDAYGKGYWSKAAASYANKACEADNGCGSEGGYSPVFGGGSK